MALTKSLPERGRSLDLELDPSTSSPAAARAFVRQAVAGSPLAETAALLTSELATNVVCHAGTPFTVRVRRGRPLRVEVEDGGAPLPVPAPPDDHGAGGRGLHIVAALAQRWGSTLVADGKVVWFEL